jgi:hypothetical protein
LRRNDIHITHEEKMSADDGIFYRRLAHNVVVMFVVGNNNPLPCVGGVAAAKLENGALGIYEWYVRNDDSFTSHLKS